MYRGISYGVDEFGRSFIIVKCYVEKYLLYRDSYNEFSGLSLFVIFQRYLQYKNIYNMSDRKRYCQKCLNEYSVNLVRYDKFNEFFHNGKFREKITDKKENKIVETIITL